jgi:predicted ATPase
MDQLSDRGSYLLRHGALAQDKQGLFVKATGVENARILRLWRNVHLFPLEDEVRAALQIVVPDVDRVSVTIDEETRPGPVPIVKLRDSDRPFPLRTMGDGMVRLFGIALALVNAKDGFLMIDEVENGLHYSVQPDVWRRIFRLASRLNVQVFATTHSWDCITGFQKAAAEAEGEDGVLVRLEEKQGKIVATCFDEGDLAVITQNDLEAR